jgi:hypothetical protein
MHLRRQRGVQQTLNHFVMRLPIDRIDQTGILSMDPQFWHERWQHNEIGFHQDAINSHLMDFWPALGFAPDSRIFVPLCGKSRDLPHTGAVTLLERFGSALNLNIHFHMLFLDGEVGSPPRFYWIEAPTHDELTRLTQAIARRIGRFLERQGVVGAGCRRLHGCRR